MPPQTPPPIAGLATGVTLFIGCTMIDAGRAIEVTSDAAFVQAFGAADAQHPLGDSIADYFANGGQVAWVIGHAAVPGMAAFHAALSQDFAVGDLVDAIGRFDLLCVPGEFDVTTQAALQAACAARNVFYIADSDPSATTATLAQGPSPSLLGPAASNAALYAPWVVATDASGRTTNCPPSGFVAGVYARTDAAHGVWKAPAGIAATLTGATGLVLSIDDAHAASIGATGINTLRTFPNIGAVVWGARTLAGVDADASARYVSVRRLVLFVESSVARGLAWTAFSADAAPLWTMVRLTVDNFLTTLWRQGALQGTTPSQAWFVRCDATTMTQDDIANGRLIVEIGIAPLKPAEFVVFRISQLVGGQPKPPPPP